MTKEQIKQWLINDGQVPEGCENNEYWSHWYDVINRMLQGQSLPIDNVSQQSELLLAWEEYSCKLEYLTPNYEVLEENIKDFLANNCG